MKTAAPSSLWAVVVRSARTEWIYWPSISRTRRGAWIQYLGNYTPEAKAAAEKERRSGRLRLARVRVEEL